jgi:hypothetical protein
VLFLERRLLVSEFQASRFDPVALVPGLSMAEDHVVRHRLPLELVLLSLLESHWTALVLLVLLVLFSDDEGDALDLPSPCSAHSWLS